MTKSFRCYSCKAVYYLVGLVSTHLAQATTSSPRDSLETIFTDPLYPQQWHLENNLKPQWKGHDINVVPVWQMGINGSGVTVAIIDDGVDYTHPDLIDNWSADSSWDFQRKNNRPLPSKPEESHGTRCAGQIAASANNSFCGVGVAFGAKIAGQRINPHATTDSLEAAAFSYRLDKNDIFSSSWGPEDNGQTVDGPGPRTRQALIKGTRQGRGGKGTIYVFASGNGGGMSDNCNFDGYANNPFTIAIGAITIEGKMPSYGEQCAAHLAVTYSGDSKNMISTTDVAGKCTSRHSGTSAAAPIAAGMMALMLSSNPNLTWRDVQYIIVETAKMTDSNDSDWKRNGAGLWINHKYGFGSMDAHALVMASKSHQHVAHEALEVEKKTTVNLDVPLEREFEDSIYIYPTETGQLTRLEHVSVTIKLQHPQRRFLSIQLTSPSGTISNLATERLLDKSTEGFMPWTFVTVRNWGENPVGKWTLTIKDSRTGGELGNLISWKLSLRGICEQDNYQIDTNGLPICSASLYVRQAHVRMYWVSGAMAASFIVLGIVVLFTTRMSTQKLYINIPNTNWTTSASPLQDLESASPTPVLPTREMSRSNTWTTLTPFDRLMSLLPQQPSFYDKLDQDSPGSIGLTPTESSCFRGPLTFVEPRRSSEDLKSPYLPSLSVPDLHVTDYSL